MKQAPKLNYQRRNIMKSILVRSFALAMLTSSISAFAASGPAQSDNANASMESNVSLKLDQLETAVHEFESSVSLKLDQLQTEVQQLEVKDKLTQDETQKTKEQQKKKIHQQNKQWEDELLGIHG